MVAIKHATLAQNVSSPRLSVLAAVTIVYSIVEIQSPWLLTLKANFEQCEEVFNISSSTVCFDDDTFCLFLHGELLQTYEGIKATNDYYGLPHSLDTVMRL